MFLINVGEELHLLLRCIVDEEDATANWHFKSNKKKKISCTHGWVIFLDQICSNKFKLLYILLVYLI